MKLKHYHGDRVSYDLGMLHGLTQAGLADPELLRLGIKSAAAFSAAGPYAGAVVNPLGPPVISNSEITVDFALNNPTRVVTPMVLDLTATRFFVDRVFTNAGGVTGGAVIYDEVAPNELYADRDVQRVAPGTEFPIVTFSRRAPKVAEVEKWGGKFYFTDEARDRNAIGEFVRATRQLSNTIVRKINQRGVEILEAMITANSRSVSGNDWGAVNTTFASGSNYTAMPARDFARAALLADQDELGMSYNLWILNPLQMFELEGIYGDKLGALLSSFGIDIFVTNRVANGTAYALAEGQVGEMRVEQPLQSVSWRDPNGKEQTWVQSSVRPLMFANNPYAVLKFTGLDG